MLSEKDLEQMLCQPSSKRYVIGRSREFPNSALIIGKSKTEIERDPGLSQLTDFSLWEYVKDYATPLEALHALEKDRSIERYTQFILEPERMPFGGHVFTKDFIVGFLKDHKEVKGDVVVTKKEDEDYEAKIARLKDRPVVLPDGSLDAEVLDDYLIGDVLDGNGELTSAVMEMAEIRTMFDNASDSCQDRIVSALNDAESDLIKFVLERMIEDGYVITKLKKGGK